ncbi:MAG: hypothetical protein LUG91_07670 [Ruminococcus sp.]|nr:hypothetical protein [Ruminococcus sp.]
MEIWTCAKCETTNPDTQKQCVVCHFPRSDHHDIPNGNDDGGTGKDIGQDDKKNRKMRAKQDKKNRKKREKEEKKRKKKEKKERKRVKRGRTSFLAKLEIFLGIIAAIVTIALIFVILFAFNII